MLRVPISVSTIFGKKIHARREFFGIFAWNIVKGGIDDYFEIDGPPSIIQSSDNKERREKNSSKERKYFDFAK